MNFVCHCKHTFFAVARTLMHCAYWQNTEQTDKSIMGSSRMALRKWNDTKNMHIVHTPSSQTGKLTQYGQYRQL